MANLDFSEQQQQQQQPDPRRRQHRSEKAGGKHDLSKSCSAFNFVLDPSELKVGATASSSTSKKGSYSGGSAQKTASKPSYSDLVLDAASKRDAGAVVPTNNTMESPTSVLPNHKDSDATKLQSRAAPPALARSLTPEGTSTILKRDLSKSPLRRTTSRTMGRGKHGIIAQRQTNRMLANKSSSSDGGAAEEDTAKSIRELSKSPSDLQTSARRTMPTNDITKRQTNRLVTKSCHASVSGSSSGGDMTPRRRRRQSTAGMHRSMQDFVDPSELIEPQQPQQSTLSRPRSRRGSAAAPQDRFSKSFSDFDQWDPAEFLKDTSANSSKDKDNTNIEKDNSNVAASSSTRRGGKKPGRSLSGDGIDRSDRGSRDQRVKERKRRESLDSNNARLARSMTSFEISPSELTKSTVDTNGSDSVAWSTKAQPGGGDSKQRRSSAADLDFFTNGRADLRAGLLDDLGVDLGVGGIMPTKISTQKVCPDEKDDFLPTIAPLSITDVQRSTSTGGGTTTISSSSKRRDRDPSKKLGSSRRLSSTDGVVGTSSSGARASSRVRRTKSHDGSVPIRPLRSSSGHGGGGEDEARHRRHKRSTSTSRDASSRLTSSRSAATDEDNSNDNNNNDKKEQRRRRASTSAAEMRRQGALEKDEEEEEVKPRRRMPRRSKSGDEAMVRSMRTVKTEDGERRSKRPGVRRTKSSDGSLISSRHRSSRDVDGEKSSNRSNLKGGLSSLIKHTKKSSRSLGGEEKSVTSRGDLSTESNKSTGSSSKGKPSSRRKLPGRSKSHDGSIQLGSSTKEGRGHRRRPSSSEVETADSPAPAAATTAAANRRALAHAAMNW